MERVGELGGDDKLDTEKNLGETEKSLRCVLRCQAKRFLTNASLASQSYLFVLGLGDRKPKASPLGNSCPVKWVHP